MYLYNGTDSQDICPSQWCWVSVSHWNHYKLLKPSYNISVSGNNKNNINYELLNKYMYKL